MTIATAHDQQLPPHKEAEVVLQTESREHEKRRHVGDKAFVLSKTWFQTWCDYVGCTYDPERRKLSLLSQVNGDREPRPRPGAIDNADLLMPIQSIIDSELWTNDFTQEELRLVAPLRSGLKEKEDFWILHEATYRLLVNWYGVVEGSEIVRHYIPLGPSRGLEIHHDQWHVKVTDEHTGVTAIVPTLRMATAGGLKEACCTALNMDDVKEELELWTRFPQSKTFFSKINDNEYCLEGISLLKTLLGLKFRDRQSVFLRRKDHPQAASARKRERPETETEMDTNVKMEAANGTQDEANRQSLTASQPIPMSTMSAGVPSPASPFSTPPHSPLTAQTLQGPPLKLRFGTSPTSCYPGSPLSRSFGKPPIWAEDSIIPGNAEDRPGLAGLSNLGNTCFMNSSVQCLCHTVPLMRTFLTGDYHKDLNHDNPLGMGGKLASAFGRLMVMLWRGGVSAVTPKHFKWQIGKFAPQFGGYAQHDAQELLAFLLDGLHEDLNRILVKPYKEEKDSDDRPDEEVAAEAWDSYKARNDSVIVDHFQGLYKSTLRCPKCDKTSVKFDPFMYLSLPLPTRPVMKTVYILVLDAMSPSPVVAGPLSTNSAELGSTRQGNNNFATMLNRGQIVAVKIDQKSATVGDVLEEVSRCWSSSTSDVRTEWALAVRKVRGHFHLLTDSKVAVAATFPYDAYDAHPPVVSSSGEEFGEMGLTSVPSMQIGSSWRPAVIAYRWQELEKGDTLPAPSPSKTLALVLHPLGQSNSYDSTAIPPAMVVIPRTTTVLGDPVPETLNLAPRDGSSSSWCLASPNFIENWLYPRLESGDTSFTRLEPNEQNDSGTQGDMDVDQSDVDQTPDAVDMMEFERPHQESGQEGVGLRNALRLTVVHPNGMPMRHFSVDDSPPALSSMLVDDVLYVDAEWLDAPDDPDACTVTEEGGSFLLHSSAIKAVEENKSRQIGKSALQPSISLDECVDAFLKPERLDAADTWYCSRCKDHVRAEKKLDLWHLPEVLVVHLKRFSYSKYTRDKIDATVDFPIRGLDLGRAVLGGGRGVGSLSAKGGTSPSPPAHLYDLYAVSNHYGGLGGGHYTAYCRMPDDGKWYSFDDSYVREVPQESIKSSSAYLLFYRRRRPEGVEGEDSDGDLGKIIASAASRGNRVDGLDEKDKDDRCNPDPGHEGKEECRVKGSFPPHLQRVDEEGGMEKESVKSEEEEDLNIEGLA